MDFPVLISYANYGYKDFAHNLLLNLKYRIQQHKVHFYCLDNDLYDYLRSQDFGKLDLIIELRDLSLSKEYEVYNSSNFFKITHTKFSILLDSLEKYGFIHFIDSDVVCIKETPLEFYEEYRDYDIVFQFDCGFVSPTQPDDNNNMFCPWVCTGNMTLRNTTRTKKLLDDILYYQTIHSNKNDQECLLQYFNDNGIPGYFGDIRTYIHAKLTVYPYERYTNGFWLDRNIGDLSKTYFFHANHVRGLDEKKKLLIKANKWLIDS
jgi:Nucleotide-diphospho-sugar transferase